MAQGLNEFLLSIELSISPPFFRLSSSSLAHLSERLDLVTFYRRSGHRRLFLVRKVRGNVDSLSRSDTGRYIFFPPPDPSFLWILSPKLPHERAVSGGYTWMWKNDGSTLMALDDFEFHLRLDEVNSLEKILTDSVY
jgi:hypothetical protein